MPIIKWFSISLNLITFLCLLGITTKSTIAQTAQDPVKETPKDRNIRIGVVQRFGSKPTDKLTLKANGQINTQSNCGFQSNFKLPNTQRYRNC